MEFNLHALFICAPIGCRPESPGATRAELLCGEGGGDESDRVTVSAAVCEGVRRHPPLRVNIVRFDVHRTYQVRHRGVKCGMCFDMRRRNGASPDSSVF
ncbi:hypothetical protein GN956_G5691 [Arapaima gigas]